MIVIALTTAVSVTRLIFPLVKDAVSIPLIMAEFVTSCQMDLLVKMMLMRGAGAVTAERAGVTTK